ncbi:hypothetical protein N7462_003563 [Penicillium macrosclerotiorum]|uniref:uncharacterized protein n=1 Tax=Penicillium macrosclerotiorum TaxID=303699 RepID=UPI002548E1F9|nr:uncharacterized protein N7462_003563 [Penicillium macrosclerotiorum]KAJ5689171.1 hypothetical protein N7462_003563 [Penicillium macrosclerotiorum]
MSRRAPPREYYEEEVYERERSRSRERDPRSYRPERDFEDDIEFRRRRSMPPVEDLERLRVRDRPPRDFMREAFTAPRDRGSLAVRRSMEEVDEREAEEMRLRMRRRGGPWTREIEEEEELVVDRDRRRHRPRPRELEQEDVVIRHRERASEGDLRTPMEKVYEDEKEKILFRPSRRPRRPRHEEEFEERIMIDRERDRQREPRRRNERGFEEELVMKWKDRPSSREQEDNDEIRMRETVRLRQSPPAPRYVRELPPGSWRGGREPGEEDDEEIQIRSQRRSRPRRREDGDEVEEKELTIRRDSRERGRRGDSVEREELTVRTQKRTPPPLEPIRAPPIHQDVITHHRHIDHGFDHPRLPRAPSIEVSTRRTSVDEVDIRRRCMKGSRAAEEDLIIKRRIEEDDLPSVSGPSIDFRDPWERRSVSSRYRERSLDESDSLATASTRTRSRRDISRSLTIDDDGETTEEEIETEDEEIEIRTRRTKPRSVIDEISNDATDQWSVVHAPANADAIEMSGALDIVEIAPKNTVEIDELELRGRVGQQILKEPEDERWTEITKDLVVREAIERLGYEFDETRTFYYIFSYLEPSQIDEIVELSDEIRKARRRRIKQMHRERATSLIDRMPPRRRLSRGRYTREREWII